MRAGAVQLWSAGATRRGIPGLTLGAPPPRPERTVPVPGAGPGTAAGGARSNEHRPRPQGGATGALPAPQLTPPLPPGAGAAVSEWHWQPVNPSAERPSSPVRRGCWLGARLRRWRRRLLPPHQSAVRPACGPPGPSTGLRVPAASTRPLPNFPPPPLSLSAARPSASSSSSAAAAAPSPGAAGARIPPG